MIRIIPCLDIRDGRVVKGVQFSGLRDAGDPRALAERYEREGADELVVLDVSATAEGRAAATETVSKVRDVLSIPMCVGGGIRSVEDARRMLEAGADKVAVNTAAVRDPDLVDALCDQFGRQCIVLSLDAAACALRQGWEVVTDAGTRRTGMCAVAWARSAAARGAGEILVTSWDRDGTGNGYDCALVRAVSDAVHLPVIASGGAAGPEDLVAAAEAGATGVLAASIFHDEVYGIGEIRRVLRMRGLEVRSC